eukprot:TRINITY_DN4227_c0_g1_i1.p1 TRINITY_DN4227_c0_g1~~TRINITY_DN4227_c0_g1_i1.p1  ORF type:complete len:630 (-),score=140.88 TRINITY_DN4227_c0_g1_i1:127-2016(-)
MKVQVIFADATKTKVVFELVISAVDRVADVKERIVSIQVTPFSEQDLVFKGNVLDDALLISESGIEEGDSVGFVIKASEATFAQQLSELLKARTVAAEELALMYTHKYGVTANEALMMVGFEGSLPDFISEQKRFLFTKGRVTSSAQAPANKAPVSRTKTLTLHLNVKQPTPLPSAWDDNDGDVAKPLASVEVVADMEETVASICTRAAPGAHISDAFPELELQLDGHALDNSFTISACCLSNCSPLTLAAKASDESLTRQLVDVLSGHGQMPVSELNLLYSDKFEIAADKVLSTIGQRQRRRLIEFLREKQEHFVVKGTSVALVSAGIPSGPSSTTAFSEHMRCLKLHERVCSRGFRVEVARAIASAVTTLMQAAFLSVHHVVVGGAVGKDTALEGSANAEVTFFLEGLTAAGHETRLPGLLKSIVVGLEDQRDSGIHVIGVYGDAVRLEMDCLSTVEVRVAPLFGTHGQTLRALEEATTPQMQRFLEAALACQQVRFVKKQAEPVKVTARLLKWWRGQQQWHSRVALPSDELLDLIAIHIATQMPPDEGYDQGVAMRLAAKLMARFDEAHIVWQTPCYGNRKISSKLLEQRPLLMDPANPFVNLADRAVFDPAEMIALVAKSSPCLI